MPWIAKASRVYNPAHRTDITGPAHRRRLPETRIGSFWWRRRRRRCCPSCRRSGRRSCCRREGTREGAGEGGGVGRGYGLRSVRLDVSHLGRISTWFRQRITSSSMCIPHRLHASHRQAARPLFLEAISACSYEC